MTNRSTLFGSLAILATLSTGSAQALERMTCPGVQPAPFSGIYVGALSGMSGGGGATDPRYRKRVPPLTCNDVNEVAKVIRAVNAMVGRHVTTPRSVELDFVKMEGNAFAAGPAFLHLPREVIFDDLAKNPVLTIPVWAHEYGHSLFMNDMARRDPRIAPFARAMNRYIQLTLTLTDIEERHALSQKRLEDCEAAKNSACVSDEQKFQAEIEKQAERVLKERQRLEETMVPLEALHQASSPFNELFADAVAVSLTGRPDAVKKSLFRTKSWQQEPRGRNNQTCYSCRDFSARENSIENWIGWRARSRNSVPSESHDVLAPSRYHLWTRYMKAGPYLKARGELLARLLDAITDTLPTVVREMEKGGMDPIAMNQLFIRAIDRRMR